MSDYKLKDAVSKLGTKPQKFTFLRGSKGTEVVISSGPVKSEVTTSINKRIGPNRAESKGTCYKGDDGVIHFATKDLSKEAVIRQTFNSAGVSTKLLFRAPTPDEEQLEGGEGAPAPNATQNVGQGTPVPNRPPPPAVGQGTPVPNRPPQLATARPTQPTAQRTMPQVPPTPQRSAQPAQPTAQRPAQPGQATTQRPAQPPANESASEALRRRGGFVRPPTNPNPATGAVPTPQPTATVPRPAGNNVVTPTPAVARPLPAAGKTDLGSRFSKTKMSQVKADTDRGLFKGMGEFKKVYEGVEGMQSAEKKLREAAKGQPLDPKSVAFLVGRYDTLLANIDDYEDKFLDDGTAKTPGRKRKASNDAKRDAKFAFGGEVRAAALEARAQLKHPDKAATLETLSQKNAAGGLTEGEERTFHQTRAELMMLAQEQGGVEQATGGTSDVKLLRNFDGSVGYVFKSIAGESDQLQLGKGAGTASEILTSKISEAIKKRCGFDSGFPKTTLAALPGGGAGGQGTPGALIEGLAGEPFRDPQGEDPYEAYGKRESRMQGKVPKSAEQLQRDKEWCAAQDELVAAAGVTGFDKADAYSNLIKKREKDKAEAIPAAAVQKIIMMNFMSSGADIKWTNVMANGSEARPFDGGGNMLSEKEMMKAAQARREDSKRGIKDGDIDPLFGEDMLYMPDRGSKHPAASQPLDPATVRQILGLNPDEIAADMAEEVRQLKAGSTDFDDAVGDSNVQSCKRSMQAMQAALRRNPNATTEEFVKAYNDEVKTWLNEVKNRG